MLVYSFLIYKYILMIFFPVVFLVEFLCAVAHVVWFDLILWFFFLSLICFHLEPRAVLFRGVFSQTLQQQKTTKTKTKKKTHQTAGKVLPREEGQAWYAGNQPVGGETSGERNRGGTQDAHDGHADQEQRLAPARCILMRRIFHPQAGFIQKKKSI